jgi:peptidoglycan/LPS O-acetylase OafA/YrhL
VITAVGLVLSLFVADCWSGARALDPLRALGESSLAMYLLHLILIRYAVSPIWPRLTFPGFGVAYVATVIALISAAYGLRRLKQRYRPRAFLMTLLLGG